jgi:hypothetical protein
LLDKLRRGLSPDLERTNAVVIVQHGAVVAERYRGGIDPDRASSWSMARRCVLVGIW